MTPPGGERDPALALLLLAARPAPPEDARARAGALLARADPDALLALAGAHGLVPLLAARAADLGLRLPPPQAEALRQARFAAVAASLRHADDLRRLVADLEAVGVRPLPFKGPSLEAAVHGAPGLRPCGDLDLLVAPGEVLAARARLLALGYAPYLQPPEGLVRPYLAVGTALYFQHPARADVDLHWRLGGPEFPIRLAAADLAAAARDVALPGGGRVRSFGPEDLLVYLCAHGGKHLWERLVWLVDVARLVAAGPALDWDRVRARAGRAALARRLHRGLRLARDLLGAPLPPEVARAVDADAAAAALAAEVTAGLGAFAPDLAARLRFAVAARERRRDRARVLLGALLLPTAHEWTSLPVPARLFAVYGAWRPLRLGAKYAGRLLRGAGPEE